MILTLLPGCQPLVLPLSPPGMCLWSPSLHTAGLGPGTLLQELEESQGARITCQAVPLPALSLSHHRHLGFPQSETGNVYQQLH